MDRLTDLRFIIGLFFSILAIILIASSFVLHAGGTIGQDLNLYSGLAVGLFGCWMLIGALRQMK